MLPLRHSAVAFLSPGRCERSRRDVPHGAQAEKPAGIAQPHATEPADARSHEVHLGCGRRAGGYVLADAADGKPDLLLLATGSELHLAVQAHEKLATEGVKSRVVSLACFELFDEQPQAYRDSVLPPGVTARVAVEAGVVQGWDRYIGPQGRFVGMTGYGASAGRATLQGVRHHRRSRHRRSPGGAREIASTARPKSLSVRPIDPAPDVAPGLLFRRRGGIARPAPASPASRYTAKFNPESP